MQNTDYGQLASPISAMSPDASQYDDVVEIGSGGVTDKQPSAKGAGSRRGSGAMNSWPDDARSAKHGNTMVEIGALSLKPNAAEKPSALHTRRRSSDAGFNHLQAADGKHSNAGWEPVSPGLIDRSPEVVATQKPGEYYAAQWPSEVEVRTQAAGAAASSSSAAAATSAGAPPLNRRGSKASELSFPLAGLEGGMLQMTAAEFKGLLRSALKSGDLATARTLMTAPLPQSVGTIQMFLKRHKHGFMSTLYPSYECFLEEVDRPFFLMSAKKRTKNKTSNYTISLLSMQALLKANSEASSTSEDPNYLGKLRSNFSGSEFVGYDAGVNPRDYIAASAAANSGAGGRRASETKLQNVRQELCTVLYDNNVMSRCPRKFKCILPGMLREDPSKRIVCRPLVPSDSLLYQYKALMASEAQEQPKLHEEQLAHQEILVLHNKQPVFEPSIGAFCLNFHGRATIASVKNFQLVNSREDKLQHKQDSKVHLQFGKMDKDIFTMDVQYPLSMVQAFEISLAGVDTKIICD